MLRHDSITRSQLSSMIRTGSIRFAGNRSLEIYGRLNCRSGKRMNTRNRVFFESEEEALQAGYRPCGHCLKAKYKAWKRSSWPGLVGCVVTPVRTNGNP